MGPIVKKRSRDLASHGAQKRQRIDLENDISQEGRKGRAVGLDELPWNEVSVDRLDDAEGFFGLEELSDIDVVKDIASGKVEYKVCENGAHKASFRLY